MSIFSKLHNKEKWWNYRFLERPIYEKNNVVDCYYELIEVYYGADGKIIAWDDGNNKIQVDSKEDLKVFLEQIKNAAKNTVMTISNRKLVETNRYIRKGTKLWK